MLIGCLSVGTNGELLLSTELIESKIVSPFGKAHLIKKKRYKINCKRTENEMKVSAIRKCDCVNSEVLVANWFVKVINSKLRTIPN